MAGIDSLKKVALTIVEFGMKLEEALSEDSPKGKKLALSEAISLGVFIAPKAIGHAGDSEQIRAEFVDLDGDELDELVTYISDKLDLANDKVELLIEAGLDWLDSTNDLRLAVQAIIKKD
jgi:hypothetical protein